MWKNTVGHILLKKLHFLWIKIENKGLWGEKLNKWQISQGSNQKQQKQIWAEPLMCQWWCFAFTHMSQDIFFLLVI